MIITIKIIALIIFVAIDIILIRTVIKGAPFAVSNLKTVKQMLEITKVSQNDKAVDIGSGDGRVVIAMAKAGADAHGFEVNPLLVWWSRWKIKQAGLQDKAQIHYKSFWKEDFSGYSLVTVFGMPHFMSALSKKLRAELEPGARVASNTFKLGKWEPALVKDRVYLYKK